MFLYRYKNTVLSNSLFILYFLIFFFFVETENRALASSVNYGASSKKCIQLKAQIASIKSKKSKTKKNPLKYKQYDHYVNEQVGELAYVKAHLKRGHCLGLSTNRNSRYCKTLLLQRSEMQNNLNRLIKKRDSYAGSPKNSNRLKAKLRKKMRRFGCYSNRKSKNIISTKDKRPKKRKSALNQLNQTHQIKTTINSSLLSTYPDLLKRLRGAKKVKTICVRTCDGYYFPISFSTSVSNLDRDASICESLCPAGQPELFFLTQITKDNEGALSLGGQKYTSLPNAYLYRKKRIKNCICDFKNPKGLLEFSSSDHQVGQLTNRFSKDNEKERFLLPNPITRPDPFAGPDTAFNDTIGFTAKRLKHLVKNNQKSSAKKTIRKVGPQYLYGPAIEEDDPIQDQSSNP